MVTPSHNPPLEGKSVTNLAIMNPSGLSVISLTGIQSTRVMAVEYQTKKTRFTLKILERTFETMLT